MSALTRCLIQRTALSASVLLALLALLMLAGCNFWAKGPEGKVFLVTMPDQDAVTFLNRFSAGLAELHAILDPLNEPKLVGLLQQLEGSFRQLDRNIGRDSPAHPVNLPELHQRLAALTGALEAQAGRSRLALAQAKELQWLAEEFASAVEAGRGPSASVDGDEDQEGAVPTPAPDGATQNAASGLTTAQAVPQQEMVAFAEQFNAIVLQVRMVLNALNAPPLARLLDQVEASFRRLERDMESGSPETLTDLTDLRQKLALLSQTIASYPCRGTRSRTILEEKLLELERLVERFSLKVQESIANGRLSDGQGDDSAALQAHIAGGNRSVCLGDPQFSARGSTGPIVQYRWNFGDGHTATGFIVSHGYRRPGDYKVTLTVVDGRGRTDTASIIVFVRYC